MCYGQRTDNPGGAGYLPCQFRQDGRATFRLWHISQMHVAFLSLSFYSREQRAKRTCLHVHLAVLCAGGTRLAPTEVKRRPAARVKYPDACIATSLMPRMLASGYLTYMSAIKSAPYTDLSL